MMRRLVPKLRFGEFSGEWEEKRLGDIVTFFKGKGVSKSDIVEDGIFECIRYGELYTEYREIIQDIKSATNLKKSSLILSKQNDILIPSSGETYVDIATASCVLKGNVALGGDLNILRGHENGVFLAYYLSHGKKNDIAKLAQGIAVVHLYSSELKKLNLHLPKPKEQQKIANTLSSLDNLIEAQKKKVEALKKHKKGLMQQLFPREGEKEPRLRFEGFSGEWENYNIDDLARVVTGNKDTQNKVDDGNYPFFVRSQTVERINSFSYDGEAILTSGDGVGVGKNFHYIVGKFDFHQRVYCICDFEKFVSGKFIYKYFSEHFNKRVMQLSAKNSVDSVRRPMITKMPISLPKLKEQQKIANCLSSLDNLIEAQNKKIEALNKHKKGLMQEMFVSA